MRIARRLLALCGMLATSRCMVQSLETGYPHWSSSTGLATSQQTSDARHNAQVTADLDDAVYASADTGGATWARLEAEKRRREQFQLTQVQAEQIHKKWEERVAREKREAARAAAEQKLAWLDQNKEKISQARMLLNGDVPYNDGNGARPAGGIALQMDNGRKTGARGMLRREPEPLPEQEFHPEKRLDDEDLVQSQWWGQHGILPKFSPVLEARVRDAHRQALKKDQDLTSQHEQEEMMMKHSVGDMFNEEVRNPRNTQVLDSSYDNQGDAEDPKSERIAHLFDGMTPRHTPRGHWFDANPTNQDKVSLSDTSSSRKGWAPVAPSPELVLKRPDPNAVDTDGSQSTDDQGTDDTDDPNGSPDNQGNAVHLDDLAQHRTILRDKDGPDMHGSLNNAASEINEASAADSDGVYPGPPFGTPSVIHDVAQDPVTDDSGMYGAPGHSDVKLFGQRDVDDGQGPVTDGSGIYGGSDNDPNMLNVQPHDQGLVVETIENHGGPPDSPPPEGSPDASEEDHPEDDDDHAEDDDDGRTPQPLTVNGAEVMETRRPHLNGRRSRAFEDGPRSNPFEDDQDEMPEDEWKNSNMPGMPRNPDDLYPSNDYNDGEESDEADPESHSSFLEHRGHSK